MIKHSAYDGQVIFSMVGPGALQRRIVNDSLLSHYPNYPNLGNDEGGDFMASCIALFILCYGTTHNIEFNLSANAPDDLTNLQAFWKGRHNKSPVELFQDSLYLVSEAVYAEWMNAYEASAPRTLAPPEVTESAVTSDDPNSESAA